MNTHRLFLLPLRILQCSISLTVLVIGILRQTYDGMIESKTQMKVNYYTVIFEYCVMNLSFVASVLYLFRFRNRRCKLKHKHDVILDCVLMNAWMIFSILRLIPQFENSKFLNCSRYESDQYEACVVYISTLVLGYTISLSYFLTAIISTWVLTDCNNDSGINNNNNDGSFKSSSLSLNRAELSEIRNSELINDYTPQVITQEGENYEHCAEISLKEFIEHNKHLEHLFKDSEFNRTDGTITIFCKPSPPFLKYETSSRISSFNENSLKYMSKYSLDSSFSKTYGSIIIPCKHVSHTSQSETDNDSSTFSRYDGSIIIGRNQIISTYSEISNSSGLSEKTSRSSRYDGSIIIKLVT